MKVLFFVLALSGIGLLSGCSKQSDQYLGYVSANYIYVSSDFSGKLVKLDVSMGDNVKQHQSLFQLDDMPEQQQAVQQKDLVLQQQSTLDDLLKADRDPVIQANEAKVKQEQAKLILAKITYERYQHLYQEKLVSEEQYDVTLSLYEASKQAVQQAQDNLNNSQLAARKDQIEAQRYGVDAMTAQSKEAQWRLAQKAVTSSTDGFVFDTYYQPGEWVPAGHPVLSILAPQQMFIQFYVSEKDLSLLKVGQSIQFECDHCQSNNTAKISYISPQAEYTPPVIYSDETRSRLVYEVKATLPLTTALQYHPGQPVQVNKRSVG